MADINRPLSPHLQVYRPQITSILSIIHRATGFFLAVGTLLLAWWVISAGAGPAAYSSFDWFIDGWIGRLALLGFTFSLFYHLCNGIRHLFWDIGAGFELASVSATGWLVLIVSSGLTLLSWIVGYVMRGAL
ncbi:MAG: succinate dehydrogenase, cytochrome b556 subunit [Alphaproteobacteria bacterium]|nr:succinate dehydrogenase, cytochrome b556 subunit [Alphaproteobacteria bacterium]